MYMVIKINAKCRKENKMSLEVNPADSVRTGQRQIQGQEQQQTVIVNVHANETPKGKPIKESVHTAAKRNAAQKTASNNVSNTQTIGSNNQATDGDNITVAGNGNMTTGRIQQSSAAIGNGNQINSPKQEEGQPKPVPPEPTTEPDPKPTIPRADAQAGKTLALRLHSETASGFANNGNISNVFGAVNDRNAYSFFKEYDKLANCDKFPQTTGAMHDSYDVWDTFNNINIKTTTPAVEALLNQAAALPGVSESDEFNTLDTLNSLAKQKTEGIKAQIRTPDLSKNESVGMDEAIKALVDRMSQEYKPQ